MKQIKNVLSLFDGMGCCAIALKELGIEYENYYASEVDKYAIKTTTHNFPNHTHLGDVKVINYSQLPKIDLIAGGSPCQSFSFAGKMKGMATKCNQEIYTLERYLELKNGGFEFEGQSYLFWEFVYAVRTLKPTYFLLENVIMEERWRNVISKALGVNPIRINANLVSAQNRNRCFWTNISNEPNGFFGDMACTIPQPKDKSILLKHVLEPVVDEKYFLSDKVVNALITYNKRQIENKNGFSAKFRNAEIVGKMDCLKIGGAGKDDLIVAQRGRKNANGIYVQDLEPNATGKTNTITSVQKDNLVMQINSNKESGEEQPYQQNRIYNTDRQSPCVNTGTLPLVQVEDLVAHGCDYRKDEGFRVRETKKSNTLMARAREDIYGTGLVALNKNQIKKFNKNPSIEKHNCLTLAQGRGESSSEFMDSVSKVANIINSIRRLTPTECKRLQSVPDWYDLSIVSETQQYKMLGNGWNCEVVKHILSYLK